MISRKHKPHIAHILTISLMWLILSADAAASDWFVRPAGGSYGSEDGTSYGNAWDGLTSVVWGPGGVQPGDNLYVCGLHVHTVDALGAIDAEADITPVSGSSGSRITIRGDYSGDPGIVWGAYKMSYDDWTDKGNGVWSIPLGGNSSDVWFFQDIGTPNNDSHIILEPMTVITGNLTGTWTFTNGSTTVTADGDGNAQAELAAGNYVQSDDYAIWLKVASVTDDDNFELTANYPSDTDENETGETLIQDVSVNVTALEALPGYFYSPSYISTHKLYVHCTNSGDPTDRIYGNYYGYDWKLTDLEYLTFLNLTFYNPNSLHPASYVRFQGCKFFYSNMGRTITLYDGSDYVEVLDCEIGYAENGIYSISGTNDSASHYIFRDNYIHHIGRPAKLTGNGDQHPIGVQGGHDGLVESNRIYYSGSGIVYYAWTDQVMKDNIIRYNRIDDISTETGGCGYGICLTCKSGSMSDKSGNKVYYNIVNNAYHAGRFSLEDEMEIYNNVFANSDCAFVSGRLSVTYDIGANFKARNNILYNSSSYHVLITKNPTTYTFDFDYNSYYPIEGDLFYSYPQNGDEPMTFAEWQTKSHEGCTFDTHSIAADPLFVDPENGNFHLLPGSLAIDAGVNVGLAQDFEGNPIPLGSAPDIGAYEAVIDPDNPPPVLQAIGNKTVEENATLTFTINATDPESEPITYLAQGLPSGATLDSQTGDFAWTPSYTQAGSYQVRFIASDGNSHDSETITITVTNVNRPPVLGAISDQSVDENNLLSFSVSATDPDGQALTYSVSGLPNGAVFASQTFTWIPGYDQAGTFAVTFIADDGQAQDSQVVTITVINVNRAPVFTAIGNKSVWSDDPLTFTIDATDPDGDAVTYSVDTVPGGATFITETFNWTPTAAQIGTYNVTFYASDGQLQDSEAITITVNVDSLAPTVTNLSPAAGAIQVPLNNLVTLNVTDAEKGIAPESVKIKVRINDNPNSDTIYFGDLDHDITLLGDCRRIGDNANYQFIFQPAQDLFYNDQTITITVNATDLAGNVMDEYSYSFVTEMHLFGQNKLVNTTLDNNDRPVTVCDSSGNIWATWHSGSAGSRDIYIGTLSSGADNFGNIVQLTNDANDQCNPALALDSNDKLYAVWQDNREGDWDIYITTSVDGIDWATERRVNDPNNGNQVNPAIVVDSQSPNYAHVVWQDDRAGNQDICIATSNDGFTTKTVSQITSDASDQVEPAVAADSAGTIYVVWTDSRNGSSDIYGAASNSGPWTNVAVVSNAGNQSSPVIAAESTGSILHLLWVDDTPGDNDIYYELSDSGLPGSPLTGISIIDELATDQLDPAIAITGTTGNDDLRVFACWQDWRNTDTDIYFTELSAGSGTNVFVNDGGSNAYQSAPAIGIDEYGYPYLIWADDRSTNTDIYYAGSTFIEPVALASALVAASAPGSTIIGVDPQAITNVDDVSVVLPSGACSYDVDISIVTILNQQVFAAPCYGSYDFGPSGIQFNQPVTITIPYVYASSSSSTVPYWFNSLTGTLSQQGITNVRDIVISPTLHAISFETTHFTPYYLLGGGSGGGGGGGGGCSVSAGSEGNIVEFVLPYIVLAVVMAILRIRDERYRRVHST